MIRLAGKTLSITLGEDSRQKIEFGVVRNGNPAVRAIFLKKRDMPGEDINALFRKKHERCLEAIGEKKAELAQWKTDTSDQDKKNGLEAAIAMLDAMLAAANSEEYADLLHICRKIEDANSEISDARDWMKKYGRIPEKYAGKMAYLDLPKEKKFAAILLAGWKRFQWVKTAAESLYGWSLDRITGWTVADGNPAKGALENGRLEKIPFAEAMVRFKIAGLLAKLSDASLKNPNDCARQQKLDLLGSGELLLLIKKLREIKE